MEKEELYKAVIDTAGIDAVLEKTVEECTELNLAILHRNKPTGECEISRTESIIEEIADVAIMVDQLAEYYGVDNISYEVNRKMDRLETRVKEGRL